ncbi:MAG: hypothetical protein IPO12_17550 [Flavobacteriales bacterium]|nr:hypothetical protein [Flavobacteriales bacterium]
MGQQGSIGGSPTGPAGSTFLWAPGTGLNSTTDPNPLADPTFTTTYVVGVQDLNGCINTDTVIVNVNPLPSISAGADTSICTGSSVQLNATGTGTFVWSPTTGLSDPNVEDPIATPAATITYTVTLTDSNDCSASDDVTVSVGSLPTIDAGTDVWVSWLRCATPGHWCGFLHMVACHWLERSEQLQPLRFTGDHHGIYRYRNGRGGMRWYRPGHGHRER